MILEALNNLSKKNLDSVLKKMDEDVTRPDYLDEIFDLTFTNQDGEKLSLDVYYKKELKDTEKPVAVILHGGGLFAGMTKIARGTAENFANKGFLVFVPEYRYVVDTDITGEVGDVISAFSAVKNNLSRFKGDSERVLLVTESAGSLLGVYASALQKSLKLQNAFKLEGSGLEIKAMCCFSGMFYTKNFDVIGAVYPRKLYGDNYGNKEFTTFMNPECNEVIGNLPPTYLVSSFADILKSYTLNYASALKKNNNNYKLDYYSDKTKKHLIHAFPSIMPNYPESIEVVKNVTEWFDAL